mgnify:CR=1 FL=1
MSRVCQVTGRRTTVGNKVSRRGLAKAKGGVGKKTTGISKRQFKVNLQWKRVWVPELDRFVRVRISANAIRNISKNGAYRTLLAAGLVKPRRTHKKKKPTPA